MMNEFENLSLDDRAKIVWDDGIYIESIVYYGYRANLYSLFNEYVEVRLHPETNEVDEIVILRGDDLNRYLNRVQLPL